MKIFTALSSEILKTKRTASFYFTIIGAAPIPAILLLNILTAGSDLGSVRKDPINGLFELGTERTGLIFFPIFVILICTLMAQIEYRNNTWKQVLASPQSKLNIFLSKFININLLIILFLVAHLFYMAIVIIITNFYDPGLNLFGQPFDFIKLLTETTGLYISMLAVCALQFWMGLRFRNFVVPVAVGFGLWITGMIMSFEFNSDIVQYFPYSFQTFPFVPGLKPLIPQMMWTSVGLAAIFLALAFLDFRNRRMSA